MMLHLKQISKVLSQGLTETPLPSNGSLDTSLLVSPILISLLSSKGIPLSTVHNQLDTLTVDNIKIYLLLVFNYYQSLKPLDGWVAMELDKNLCIMIEQVGSRGDGDINGGDANGGSGNGASGASAIAVSGNNNDDPENNGGDSDSDKMYVVVLYDKKLPNSLAKLKLDNLASGLAKGFDGYKS